ncbi:MAG: Ig-like domain-containing protein [Candidatus Uhrbacteria bacterium]|nr:Ig-like domain-containing protein [Candidatus Uhrbacteria bacterium]
MLPTPLFAQVDQAAKTLQTTADATGLGGGSDLLTIIGRIINIALGFVGFLILVYLIYAGFLWLTSGGAEEGVKKAKLMIRNAVIGLAIVASAFAIVNFILSKLAEVTDQGGGIISSGVGGIGFPGASGSLGRGIIEYHLPSRDATGVPRNTPVIITFKEPIKLSSMIKDYDGNVSSTKLNVSIVKIYPTGHEDQTLTAEQANVRFTKDQKIFVIKPVSFLGNAVSKTNYTVELGTGLQREDGRPAFSGSFSQGYKWQFEVSTVIDTTPPQITSVIPSSGGLYAPNIVVQVNFSEAVDPTGAAGIFKDGSGFTNMEVQASPAGGGAITRPNGEFKISNAYTTVEFVTDLSCGTNSCGRKIYCLPFSSGISVLVKAATLSTTPPQALLSESGYDGITDVVGNSLDGNADGQAQGPPKDHYSWNFGTSDKPNLDPPTIIATRPRAGDKGSYAAGGGSSKIPLDLPPEADFDSVLQASTLTSDSAFINTNEPPKLADTFWWTTQQQLLSADGQVATSGAKIVGGRVRINHRLYVPASTIANKAVIPEYDPYLISDLQNIYQNCFYPAASKTCAANPSSPNCCDERSSNTACQYPLFPFTP